jgi:acylphosphatase
MRRAQEQKISGWVRNRSDGTVEIEAVGARSVLEEFLSYVRVGPAAANVSNAHVAWHEDEPSYATFDVKF